MELTKNEQVLKEEMDEHFAIFWQSLKNCFLFFCICAHLNRGSILLLHWPSVLVWSSFVRFMGAVKILVLGLLVCARNML